MWLRLAFESDGFSSPAVDEVRIEFPRVPLRRYLPAVFGEEPVSADFTDRFLANFDTTLRSIESEIDNEAALFDPLSSPAKINPTTGVDFLSWLASWVGVQLERQWPESKRRHWLKGSASLFRLRGTREGLYRQLLLLLDLDKAGGCCAPDCGSSRWQCVPPPSNCAPVECCSAWEPPPLILEHFQLRRWLYVGVGRIGDDAQLWGQRIVNRSQLGAGAQAGGSQLIVSNDPLHDPFHVTAHRYSVFVPARYGKSDARRRSLLNLLRSESPAHVQYQLELVEPRFRIGFQSSIGLDTVVGRYPASVELDSTVLCRGSVLPPARRSGPSMSVGDDARIGSTTLLT
jgi:phage tail-like protein